MQPLEVRLQQKMLGSRELRVVESPDGATVAILDVADLDRPTLQHVPMDSRLDSVAEGQCIGRKVEVGKIAWVTKPYKTQENPLVSVSPATEFMPRCQKPFLRRSAAQVTGWLSACHHCLRAQLGVILGGQGPADQPTSALVCYQACGKAEELQGSCLAVPSYA